jgi:hypothetical protein
MFNLTRLFQALGQLANALSGLSETVNEANARLRAQLSLDAPQDLVLPHQPAQDATNGQEPAEDTTGRPRGRRRSVETA